MTASEPGVTPTAPRPRISRAERPLSPHLSIYKPQITSVMSIFHRATGIALSFGLVVFALWIICLTFLPRPYELMRSLLLTPVGKIGLVGMLWAFLYHFCCGIRHLFWDAGYLLTNEGVASTGRIALGISTLCTIGITLKAFGYHLCPWM